MTKFSRQWDKSYKGYPGMENNGKDLCVPDQNISLRELMYRHTRGLPIDGNVMKNGEYYGVEIPKITDLTDIENYRERLKVAKDELMEAIKAESDKKKGSQKKDPVLDNVSDGPGNPDMAVSKEENVTE